ncbi:hypothetical protein GH714_018338 [Hevea brasiliensis]|uniref:Phytocyanin domain-containing protein n=1 Tax=Hevea brasiliensis TaxID=3981 RepID=A0A6A6N224_HEVBR|nr:hypothetical protein GH714_018338 [Hevea brasiliensis]
MLLLLRFKTIQAATYIVGDDLGWTSIVSMEAWPQGKTLYAGDILVFIYDASSDNVVVEDQQGHDTCTITEKAIVFRSGHDRIRLSFGANYFITSNHDNCALGMKMAINATTPALLQ